MDFDMNEANDYLLANFDNQISMEDKFKVINEELREIAPLLELVRRYGTEDSKTSRLQAKENTVSMREDAFKGSNNKIIWSVQNVTHVPKLHKMKKCYYCNFRTTSEKIFTIHMKREHPGENFNFNNVKNTVGKLVFRKRKYTDNDDYKNNSSDRENILNHERKKDFISEISNNKKESVCIFCALQIPNGMDMRKHVSLAHNTFKPKF